MSDFEKLLAELNTAAENTSTLAKSLPADGEDDKAIQAAAADGDADNNPEDDADGGAEDGDADDKPMAKSLTIDGEDVEVIDGEQILKSLNDMDGRMTATEQVLAKALGSMTVALGQQNDLIKALNEKVEKLSGQGRGRKTVLAIHEKQDPATLAKSEPKGLSGPELMAKSLAAQQAGKLTALDVARVEASLNAGIAVSTEILQKLN